MLKAEAKSQHHGNIFNRKFNQNSVRSTGAFYFFLNVILLKTT